MGLPCPPPPTLTMTNQLNKIFWKHLFPHIPDFRQSDMKKYVQKGKGEYFQNQFFNFSKPTSIICLLPKIVLQAIVKVERQVSIYLFLAFQSLKI